MSHFRDGTLADAVTAAETAAAAGVVPAACSCLPLSYGAAVPCVGCVVDSPGPEWWRAATTAVAAA